MKLHWDEEDLDWDDTNLSPEEEDDDMDPDDPLYTLFFDDD